MKSIATVIILIVTIGVIAGIAAPERITESVTPSPAAGITENGMVTAAAPDGTVYGVRIIGTMSELGVVGDEGFSPVAVLDGQAHSLDMAGDVVLAGVRMHTGRDAALYIDPDKRQIVVIDTVRPDAAQPRIAVRNGRWFLGGRSGIVPTFAAFGPNAEDRFISPDGE